MEWSVPLERCVAIARRIYGDTLTEREITDIAEDARAFALAAPPLTAEQRDTITALLRP